MRNRKRKRSEALKGASPNDVTEVDGRSWHALPGCLPRLGLLPVVSLEDSLNHRLKAASPPGCELGLIARDSERYARMELTPDNLLAQPVCSCKVRVQFFLKLKWKLKRISD